MMTGKERGALIVKAVTSCAKMASREVDDFGLDMYVASLAHYEGDEFARIIARLREAYKCGHLPKVGELEDAAHQRATGTSEVDEAVGRICAGIRQFGYSNLNQAAAFIGELGWAIVTRYGGWRAVCAVESEKDLAIMRAQMRATGESVRERAALGVLNQAPRLPEPEGPPPRGLAPAGRLLGEALRGTH